jgi:GTPase SAR1 family protein
MKFKVVLVGPKGSGKRSCGSSTGRHEVSLGKSSLINRLRYGNFNQEYTPSINTNVIPIIFNTNIGPVALDIWDCATGEKLLVHDKKYYTNTHAGLILLRMRLLFLLRMRLVVLLRMRLVVLLRMRLVVLLRMRLLVLLRMRLVVLLRMRLVRKSQHL